MHRTREDTQYQKGGTFWPTQYLTMLITEDNSRHDTWKAKTCQMENNRLSNIILWTGLGPRQLLQKTRHAWRVAVSWVKKSRRLRKFNFPTDSRKFPTEEIMGAQNFNAALNLPQILHFWMKIVDKNKIF